MCIGVATPFGGEPPSPWLSATSLGLHIWHCRTRNTQAERRDAFRDLDKNCGDMEACVWLKAVWKIPDWESVSRKYVVTCLRTLLGRGCLWPKYLKWTCLEGQKIHVKNMLAKWKPPFEADSGACQLDYLMVFQGTLSISLVVPDPTGQTRLWA